MSFLDRIFHRAEPEPQPVRFVVANRQENRRTAARRTTVTLQLAVYAAVTPRAQAKAETEAYFASVRSPKHEGRG